MARRSNSGNNKTAAMRRPGRLRIVAGNWRNRVLEVADVAGLRPTTERIRETLFNWLALDIVGAHCLDLFAGTGALGLEALSRGAAEVTFVEKAPRAVATLQRNVQTLAAKNAIIHTDDAAVFLGRSPNKPFDVVFLDPPFADDKLEELCRLLLKGQWLAANARVYLEQQRTQSEPALPDGWGTLKHRTAGNVRYSLVAVD